MAKATSNEGLETVARLLDIVPFLSTHQGIAIGDLAAAFKVSTDQITKDLTTLWMCGLPGYTAYELIDLSFDSGFVTISNAETLARPRALDKDEVLALLLGLEFLHEDLKESEPHLVDLVSGAIKRLTTLIDEAVGRSVQAGDSSSSALLAAFEKSVTEGSRMDITYHSVSRDEITHRTIEPIEISSDERFSYIYAFCELSKGYRTFRADRIIEFAEKHSEQRESARIRGESDQPTIQATVQAFGRQRDIFERLQSGSIAASEDQTLHVQCFSADWAVREIMSFGGSAQISHPESVRLQIFERASRALAAYQE